LLRVIEPALVFNITLAWGVVPTSALMDPPAALWFTVTGKLVLIEPASVLALR